MEFSPNILRCVLLLVAGYLGTTGLPEATRAQCSNIEPVGFNGVQAVEGKPFQAREITKIVTYRGDETKTKRMQVVKAHLFRDSKGESKDSWMARKILQKTVPTDILVYDNCGTRVSLIPSRLPDIPAKSQRCLFLPKDQWPLLQRD